MSSAVAVLKNGFSNPLGSAQNLSISKSLNSQDEDRMQLGSVKGNATETKTETKVEEIPFETKQVTSDQYQSGTKHILTNGQNGLRTITYEVQYTNGVEVSRTETDNKVNEKPTTEIIALGTRVQTSIKPVVSTNSCDPNYVPCVPVSSSDLDCSDIKITVQIIGSDPHKLDEDSNGVACESYN